MGFMVRETAGKPWMDISKLKKGSKVYCNIIDKYGTVNRITEEGVFVRIKYNETSKRPKTYEHHCLIDEVRESDDFTLSSFLELGDNEIKIINNILANEGCDSIRCYGPKNTIDGVTLKVSCPFRFDNCGYSCYFGSTGFSGFWTLEKMQRVIDMYNSKKSEDKKW